MLKRTGIHPQLRFAITPNTKGARFSQRFFFRKSWVAIGVLLAMDLAFILPAWFTFQQAVAGWGSFDSLFGLVTALFLSAWLIGWLTAPVLITTILLVMLFGREVVTVRERTFEVFIGLPLGGALAVFDTNHMRNLRFEKVEENSGHSWRGDHLAFDYGAQSVRGDPGVVDEESGLVVGDQEGGMKVDFNRSDVRFGSSITTSESATIIQLIQQATRGRVRDREPSEQEIHLANTTGGFRLAPELGSDGASGPVDRAAAKSSTPGLSSLSTLALIAANLIPLAGTVFFGWSLSDVMVLYWAETAIIGFYNLLKMAFIGGWMVLFAGPFFLGHFGGFMAMHFLFIYGFFVDGPGFSGGGDLREVASMFAALMPALIALFISHGVSFLQNFIGHREFADKTMQNQMTEPYKRIIFMHLVIIFGGGLALVLGEPTPVILLVIVLKMVFDVRAHVREHDPEPGG